MQRGLVFAAAGCYDIGRNADVYKRQDKTIPSTMPAENITLTARWTENRVIVIIRPDDSKDEPDPGTIHQWLSLIHI